MLFSKPRGCPENTLGTPFGERMFQVFGSFDERLTKSERVFYWVPGESAWFPGLIKTSRFGWSGIHKKHRSG
jgi:hypothetical protein